MSTPRRITNTRSVREGERGAVEEYIIEIGALYETKGFASASHAAFLVRVSAVLPYLTESEYRSLCRALWAPRLATLARAVAETRPDLLE